MSDCHCTHLLYIGLRVTARGIGQWGMSVMSPSLGLAWIAIATHVAKTGNPAPMKLLTNDTAARALAPSLEYESVTNDTADI